MLPPEGWVCTRSRGHQNPCAAWPIHQTLDDKLITMSETIGASVIDYSQRQKVIERSLQYLREVASHGKGISDV